MFGVNKTFALVALVGLSMLAGVGAATASQADGEGEHCVVEVLGQKPSGEFVLSDPFCYDTFARAALVASSGTVRLDPAMTPGDLETTGDVAAALSTFTLGIHYDGYGGSGSSISVVGSNCSGGYWNTPTIWDDRISSTWNGCYRTKHHDLPGTGGAYRSTVGVGSVHNMPSLLNNDAESISHWNS